MDSYSKEDIEKAETAYLAFLDFVKKNSLEIVFSEKSLIHNNFKYGGTVDIYAKLNDTISNITLKIGNSSLYTTSITLNTSYRKLYSHIGVGGNLYLWAWADFYNYYGSWSPN